MMENRWRWPGWLTVNSPARLRGSVMILLIPVIVYSVACVIYNAPASPAAIRLYPAANAVIGSYFSQDWQLFGPTPGIAADSLVVQALLRSANGSVTLSPAEDVEYQVDRLPRANRLLPTKLPTVILGFQEVFAQYANTLMTIQKAPRSARATLIRRLNQNYRDELGELDRFLSVEAQHLFPGMHISSVRAIFSSTPIVPYSQRYQNPPPPERNSLILRTDWMPFIPGVAN
jgi:hypothetical protein